ncbi:2-amino-4-hydroxy-6-hydroxymethyldihydropteridinediphosphokinase [Jatrophihabitans endophyticus]|uniref:2-amino-4-hydroxy-6-hydroxymethyldihydropteridine diphosphokinase n=1 Tax=Jatrophihabitans endophyticus TaxID=1206085 RepID=A0A1M5R537_9ACTN|nr:2-amino-4-hydroxy-6-hydroxymethyldihydropteridine diphosphokinase [Jatrophihabitans endophyticus]SHH21331.1 2-amino-4-hydroxy-6-hydroxymethyldihydropteridinediphosphokinase [Jatrophihabitans endophyticus]
MSRAVLSLGSNLGDRRAALRLALDVLAPWVQAVSPVYETAPWGPVPQQDYLNAVVVVADPAASPRDWLARAHAAESAAGRVRDVRWGPRTLDVDVVTVETAGAVVESDDPELTLPHPRAAQRAFVLVPWTALEPDAELAGRPLAAWLAALPADEVDGVRLVAAQGRA